MLLRIEDWKVKETSENVKHLTAVINQITPCYVKGKYIYYQMLIPDGDYKNYSLEWYNRNLVLLNFIRYLWNSAAEDNKVQGDFLAVSVFFETLKKSRYKDSFKKLSKANKEYSEAWFSLFGGYSPGHSCIQKGSKILSTVDFLKNKESAQNFFK